MSDDHWLFSKNRIEYKININNKGDDNQRLLRYFYPPKGFLYPVNTIFLNLKRSFLYISHTLL